MKLLFSFFLCISASGLLQAENLLPNSSFELGTAGWGIRTIIPKKDGNYRVIREKISSRSTIHGASVLELPNPDGYSVQLCSVGIPVKPEKYTFSIWLKGSRSFPVELQLFSTKTGNWFCPGKKFTVTTEWKRYTLTTTLPEGFSETVVRVQFHTSGTLFLDAAQFERGNRVSGYTPVSPVEAAVFMPKTWAAAGRHNVGFLAIRYAGDEGNVEFRLCAENRMTGWNREIHRTFLLPPGKTVRANIPFLLDNRGFIEFRGDWKEGTVLPFYTAVLNQLPPGRFSPGQGFCTGVNETGVFRNAGEAHNPYQGLGIDFSDHLAMLHATGVSLVRLFEYELSRSWYLNPERGKFDFSCLNPYLNAVAESDLIPYICLDTEAFSWNPESKNPNQIRKKRWFMVQDGEKAQKNPMKSITVYPQMNDWRAYIDAYVRNCRGRVRYYEIINEPNLRLTDPARYASYLKEAYRTAKNADPDCRIIGICATEDYGAAGGNYTGKCAELGAFQDLDAVSFHPYESALDTSEVPAARLLEKLNRLRRRYRPGVPLWNSEVFYLHSLRDKQKYRWTNPQFLRPQNLARRYLIDLGEGVQVSTPLYVWQLFEKVYVRQTADQTWFGHKAVPNAAAVAQNAFARFLRGAKSLGRAVVPSGVNGYHYRTANGREITAIWALEDLHKFFLSVPKSIRTYDLFGNPIDCTSNYILSECPVYLEGRNLKEALKQLFFRPQVAIAVSGARFRDSSTLAVEFQNRLKNPQSLFARIQGEPEIRQFTIPANSSRTVHFRTVKTAPVLLWISGESQQRNMLNPIAPRKTIRSGETVKINNALEFSVRTDKNVLSVSVSVKDLKRGERIKDQPWTGDCVELFLDTKPEIGLDNHLLGADVYRLFLFPASANGLPAGLTGSSNLDLRKIKWSLTENKTGYSGRIEIPWKVIGCKAPAELGFDIIADNAEGNKRVACHAWAGDDRNCYSRFQFGRLLLVK